MRLLIVEDEHAIGKQIQDFFEGEGMVVDWAQNGTDGAYFSREYEYELAIIDLGLPGQDGMSIIRDMRKLGRSCPVLILTARGDWQDKVEGLEAGADDYLVKPFHIEELRARANALIRRAAGHAHNVMEFGELSIDRSAKLARIAGTQIELTSYEFNTLEYLALNKDKAVSKSELTEHLYHQDYERDSNVIEVFIGRLRKKLAPLDVIKTVRGQGYRFSPQ
ncbi:response regulator transcription factor [Agaribacterium haliotis]|uniref:response regulator transcription factor n=1 Tax=Agaribacterium haliotis TaxID=2013869 RepID=UPI000BB566CB|nr:response regulator transcription factor [Agaribacterium haliotis]